MNSSLTHVIGIDISKDTISVRLLGLGDSPLPIGGIQTFSNCETGYRQLERWLSGLGVVANSTQVVMEATGVYWEGCAWYCHEQGFQVSVVNPAQIKYFARTTLMRGKTDPLDADLIARFGVAVKPRFWTPPDETLESLRIFVHQREAYVAMLTEEKNRLHAFQHRAHCPQKVITMTKSHIRFLEKRIAELEQTFKDLLRQKPNWQRSIDLLTSIPGVGLITATILYTETHAFSTIVASRQLTAFAGVAPAPFLSGTSVHHQTRISKIGNPRIRQAVYLASVSGVRFNPALKTFYQRLRDNGKPTKVALVAVSRKLLTIAFALIQSQRPFDPNYVSTKTKMKKTEILLDK
ncbi:MAG: IS110 family transposase [Candidatus Latescibacteria bacterium]|nr:IS110 family transposase [Candidatus Latescibacterota bacterium]